MTQPPIVFCIPAQLNIPSFALHLSTAHISSSQTCWIICRYAGRRALGSAACPAPGPPAPGPSTASAPRTAACPLALLQDFAAMSPTPWLEHMPHQLLTCGGAMSLVDKSRTVCSATAWERAGHHVAAGGQQSPAAPAPVHHPLPNPSQTVTFGVLPP